MNYNIHSFCLHIQRKEREKSILIPAKAPISGQIERITVDPQTTWGFGLLDPCTVENPHIILTPQSLTNNSQLLTKKKPQ